MKLSVHVVQTTPKQSLRVADRTKMTVKCTKKIRSCEACKLVFLIVRYANLWHSCFRHRCGGLGPFQTSNFTCAESNANEKNLLFSLICISFGTCKVQRLKRALVSLLNKHSWYYGLSKAARTKPAFTAVENSK